MPDDMEPQSLYHITVEEVARVANNVLEEWMEGYHYIKNKYGGMEQVQFRLMVDQSWHVDPNHGPRATGSLGKFRISVSAHVCSQDSEPWLSQIEQEQVKVRVLWARTAYCEACLAAPGEPCGGLGDWKVHPVRAESAGSLPEA